MTEREKPSKGLFGLFKKDKSTAPAEPVVPLEERKRLVSTLSASEKAKRRSTIGPSSNVGAGFATLSTASISVGGGGSPAITPPTTPVAVKSDIVDTQYSKMLKRPSTTGLSRDSISASSVSKGSADNVHSSSAKSPSKKELSKEDKKQRRKSLLNALAPSHGGSTPSIEVRQSISSGSSNPSIGVALGSGTGIDAGDGVGDSSAASTSALSKEVLKARRSTNIGTIFKKDNSLEELSFSKLGVQSTASQAEKQLQKQKQKQLQKQMERDSKKQEKHEKAKQERAHEILQAQLDLGRERATMPEPQSRFVAMAPSRPARLTSAIS